MPYADEHSCRLIAPAEFDEFRRQNNWKQIDGKRVDAIFGIRDGKSELAAMRYPKNDWSSSDARSHCSSQDGILFEPAAAPQIREERMAHITKFVRPEIKVVDKAAGIIAAIVSTESMDRDGDIIRQESWDLSHFKAHPILLSSHNYRGLRNQIGEWTQMGVQGKQLVGEAKYYVREGNEEADWGFNLAKKGRAAFSVGFVPDMSKAKQIEANGNLSYEFNGQELLEVSQVTVPSNPQALQAMKGLSLHPEVDVLVTEMLAEVDIEEVVEEIREQSVGLDHGRIVEELTEVIRNEVRSMFAVQTESVPVAVLPTAEDIIKQVLASYKEGK
jgi:hypothetical protein